MNNKYDAIVIGSGIGGLTTAALLSKIYKKKVLVLEQHFVPGGQTHEFTRVKAGNKYHWDVGVHYIGGMDEGYFALKLFNFLTDGKLDWHKMPYEFETFVYPDFSFKQPSNKKEFIKRLIEKFPDEEPAILKYFSDVKKASSWLPKNMVKNATSSTLGRIIKLFDKSTEKLALSTTKEYLDKNFKDEKIKALLTSIWGDYGLPPSQSAFLLHSIVVSSYFHGAFFPVGGATEIAKTIIPVIEKEGGKVLTSRNVTEIIIENNTAIGVNVQHRQETETYYADKIISDVGIANTFKKLVKGDYANSIVEKVKKMSVGYSAVTLYLGLKESPEKLGIKGENYWIYAGYNHEDVIKNKVDIENPQFKFAFLSFPSMKNPKAQAHTAEVISILPYEIFEKWKDRPWMKRDKEYYDFKDRISRNLIAYVDKTIPGFSELVAYQEVSTPLTMEYFTKWEKGSFYGIPGTPERYKSNIFKPQTDIKNLFLTGTDVASLGVMGAVMGGVLTTGVINGALGFFKIMGKIKAKAQK